MAHRSKLAGAIALAGCFLFSAQAQTALTVKVMDALTYKGVPGAQVMLPAANITETTNAAGVCSLSTPVRFFAMSPHAILKTPSFRRDMLTFGVVPAGERVRIDVYNVMGRSVACLLDRTLESGNYQINPYLSTLSSQIYFVKIQAGAQAAMLKIPLVNKRSGMPAGVLMQADNGSVAIPLAKKTDAVVDSIVVTATGYTRAAKPLYSYSGTVTVWMGTTGIHAGTITFDQASYSGTQYAAAVIVNDLDLTGPTVQVRVKTRADTNGFTLSLKQDTSMVGQYIDSIRFSINGTDSLDKIIKVQQPAGTYGDSVYAIYADSAPAALDTTTTQWYGNAGTIGPGASMYSGLQTKITVNLSDPDLSDSTEQVLIKDDADTVGIELVLHPVAGSWGTYSGLLGVSTQGSNAALGVIKVFGTDILDGENITMFYYDQTPVQVKTGSICTWRPILGSVVLDTSSYMGTTKSMNITLYDGDIAGNNAVVTVKSKKDPTGFIDTLKYSGTGAAGVFSGQVGFTTGATQYGMISVASPDSVSVFYYDTTPDSTVVQRAAWSN